MKRRLRFALVIVLVMILSLPLCCVLSFWNRVGSAKTAREAPIGGLPDDAIDIHWQFPKPLWPTTLYDFKTSPEGFKEWADRSKHWGLKGPYSGRATTLYYDLSSDSMQERTFDKAIVYSWEKDDQGMYLIYDLLEGRAYYHSHTR
jgi:hypothetical protein